MRHAGFLRGTGIAGLAIVLAAGLPGLAGAGGGAPKIAAQLHMHGTGPDPTYDHWVGDVHSRKRKCERRRTVTVYYEGENVGSDVTDRYGHWAIPISVPGHDPYFAVVSRKLVGQGANELICKADRSPRFGFPPL
jgi:hypothetical protein